MSVVESLGNGAFVCTTKEGISAIVTETKPTLPGKRQELSGDEKWLPWFNGDNNLWPQDVVKAVEASDVLPQALDKMARTCYGRGLVYGYVSFDENGREKMKPAYKPEVKRFCRESNTNAYLLEAAHDNFWFGSPFPELIFNKGGGIKYIHELDATQCRLGKQTGKNNLIDKVFVSGDWSSIEENKPIQLPAIDHYHDPLGQAQTLFEADKSKFVMPLARKMNGRVAYELPLYAGILKSDWMKLSKLIPSTKLSRIKKNLSVAYHIEIDPAYWTLAYPDWEDKSPEDKRSAKEKVIEAFVKNMTGEKGNRVLMTERRELPTVKGKEMSSLWVVNELKGDNLSEEYLEDSRETDFHLGRSTGLHSSLVGVTPGKGRDSGAGSVERVAFNNLAITLKPDQDKILSPLNDIIIPLNGWDKDDSEEKGEFKFWVMNYYIATLDTGGEVSKNQAS